MLQTRIHSLTRRTVSTSRWTVVLVLIAVVCTSQARAEDLQALIQQLLQRNPVLQAARRSVDARKARVIAARTLPEPSVSLESMGNLVPPTLQRGDPSSARVLKFTQEIPFPGKLDLQGQIASAAADVEWWKYEEVRRVLVAELRTAYYDLFLAQKTTEILEKNKILLEQFAEISEVRYKVGQAAQQDVLKARVEVSRLIDRLSVLSRESDIAQSRINTLVFRSPETPLGRLPELARPKFARTMDQLYERTAANNPRARMNRKEIDRGELQVALSKKSFYPDFEVGFSYFNRRGMPEMYGVMFRAKIPLYFWRRQGPELESSTSELIAQRRQYDATLSALYLSLKDPFLKTRTDENLLDLYGGAIIPQATLALESSISSYRVGSVDFLTLLSNLGTLLEYEVKYYEVLVDYYKALAMLESISGEALVP